MPFDSTRAEPKPCAWCGELFGPKPSMKAGSWRAARFCSNSCSKRVDPATRFWQKVDKTDGCWNWTAAQHRGYGVFGLTDPRRRTVQAHRWAYEHLIGPIPEDLELDHLCRNRACVNPDHLEPVTSAENTRRGEPAQRTHCPHGHEYTAENTKVHNGKRFCRACANARGAEYSRRFRARRKAESV